MTTGVLPANAVSNKKSISHLFVGAYDFYPAKDESIVCMERNLGDKGLDKKNWEMIEDTITKDGFDDIVIIDKDNRKLINCYTREFHAKRPNPFFKDEPHDNQDGSELKIEGKIVAFDDEPSSNGLSKEAKTALELLVCELAGGAIGAGIGWFIHRPLTPYSCILGMIIGPCIFTYSASELNKPNSELIKAYFKNPFGN